jgi:hypothetical protein
MKNKEMNKLIKHFEFYFNQDCEKIYHDNNEDIHIDILLFEPNDQYPFYKLVTMGASDYAMPKVNSTLPNRNEYIIFLSKDVEVNSEDFNWYINFLSYVSKYAFYENTNISVGHNIELAPNSHPNFKNAFILFPEIIEDSWVLRCQLGMFKTCACLQVMPITENENAKNLSIGSEEFHNCFYPEEGEPIFLANRIV